MQELENIDDEADQLGIGFVKIHDEKLADEYNLGELPRLVYYRHKTPIIYESMLRRTFAKKNYVFCFTSHFVAFILLWSGERPSLRHDFSFSRAIFTDELSREEDVLEWLIENKSTGDDEDVIEEVSGKNLGTLIQNIDNLVVVFCEFCIEMLLINWKLTFEFFPDGKDDDDSNQVIEELEKIDDDCDKHGIQFVKIDDRAAAKEHGVKDVK